MATPTTSASNANTRRSSSAKRPARPRAKTTGRTTASSARTASRRPARPATAVEPTLGSYAERAVLIPVGAALIARERVAASVSDTIERYSTPSKASAQLRRFERRGNTARNRVERELRKTRVRVEREARQTRRRIEREVRRRRRDGEELATRVQERIASLV